MTELHENSKDDHFSKRTYLRDKDVTVETFYRMNFSGERSCGYLQILRGDPKGDEEAFEIYKELIECGLSRKELGERHKKIVDEIESGKLDVML